MDPASLPARWRETASFRKLAELVAAGSPVRAEGLWGASRALLVAALAGTKGRAGLLAVVATPEEAETFLEDLALFGAPAAGFPAWRGAGGRDPLEEPVVARARLEFLARRAAGEPGVGILVAEVAALLQPLPAPEQVCEAALTIRPGERLDREALAEWLANRGYRAAELVENQGEFCRRGGIFDLFPAGAPAPARLELRGEVVEEIRPFDPASQRSGPPGGPLVLWGLSGARPAARSPRAASLAAYLPEGVLPVLVEPAQLARQAEAHRESGARGDFALPRVLAQLRARGAPLALSALPGAGEGPAVACPCGSLAALEEGGLPPLARLAAVREGEGRVLVFCHNAAERDRLAALAAPVPPWLELALGTISAGCRLPELGLTLAGHQEVFARYRVRRRFRAPAPGRPLAALAELAPGDLVVHVQHGIGRFRGLATLERGGSPQEHLVLEFREKALLYVPAAAAGLVQKYVGGREHRPALSTVGGSEWARRRLRAARAVADLAGELLQVQAARQGETGLAFPPDDAAQRAFEAAFIYQETPDQLAALAEIKRDQESPRPMDRLLCGDVGFGKTELAIRAAFKVANAGRQVAVLAPTTILVQQHAQTFRERLADYPLRVEGLSRFLPRLAQRRLLAELAAGRVDIVIGTHRLVQPDVAFRDLGLVVIDEEQRFGVEHKERLKRLRRTVDVLTMTATPIPRTLHLALLGLRDISTLAAPPADRRAIETVVAREDPELVRESCRRELERGGQVYYVHNRILDIERVAQKLRELLPGARLEVLHGRLPERQIEERMARFIAHQADILVSTSIIESGIDLPRVNTLIVDTPERFGLADLHQLRGRVGRYRERARACFLVGATAALSPRALRRLKALEEFSELGAGIRLAQRDLEIRGVGNLLGREQHGHLAAVGYELYCQLLAEAVARLAGRPPPPAPAAAAVELPLPAALPVALVPQAGARLDFYRRLALASSPEQLAALGEELADRFGACPPEAANLLLLQRLRLGLERAGIFSLVRVRGFLELRLRRPQAARAALAPLGERLREVAPARWLLALEPAEEEDPARLAAFAGRLAGALEKAE